MSDEKRARLRERLKSGKTRLHPLSLTQRELWESAPFAAEDVSNNIGTLIFAKGPVRPDLMQKAFQQVIDRHEVLRLAIMQGKTQPVQVINDTAVPALVFRDAALPDDAAIGEAAEAIFREPIDLARGPLYQMVALRRGVDDHVFVLSIHHAISDGWSLGVLVEDLLMAYINALLGQGTSLPPVDLSFSDWAAQERALWTPAELEPRAAFWRSHMAGAGRVLSSAPAVSSQIGRHVSRIDGESAGLANEVARQTGATLFGTLLAAFQLTLSEWTGADDIVVGTPVANRSRRAVRKTIGSFAGVVPLRGRVAKDRGFRDHVTSVHQDTVESFAHAMPFTELAAALGEAVVPGQNPIFDVRFALQNHPMPDVSYPGLSVGFKIHSSGTERFDLACEITEEGDEMEVVWLYRQDLFKPTDIAELARLWDATLARNCREALNGGES